MALFAIIITSVKFQHELLYSYQSYALLYANRLLSDNPLTISHWPSVSNSGRNCGYNDKDSNLQLTSYPLRGVVVKELAPIALLETIREKLTLWGHGESNSPIGRETHRWGGGGHDGSLHDCLLDSMVRVQSVDDKAVFVFTGDANAHH